MRRLRFMRSTLIRFDRSSYVISSSSLMAWATLNW